MSEQLIIEQDGRLLKIKFNRTPDKESLTAWQRLCPTPS